MWHEHTLSTSDHELAWYEFGSGRPVIWINGGPGDNHSYLRNVAEEFGQGYRNMLYDQRGTGRSVLRQIATEFLTIQKYCEDIESLRSHLGVEKLTLIGHSWGANLAVMYGSLYPERTQNIVAVGMGPMDTEMARMASGNLLKVLTSEERDIVLKSKELALRAAERGELQEETRLRNLRVALTLRGWFYDSTHRERFIEQYFATGADKAFDKQVNRLTYESYLAQDPRGYLKSITSPLTLLYGYQDYAPLIQGEQIARIVPTAECRYIHECGHLPWLEQPQVFKEELARALSRASAAGARNR